eukprot:2415587-Prymnesium_polylepis.1
MLLAQSVRFVDGDIGGRARGLPLQHIAPVELHGTHVPAVEPLEHPQLNRWSLASGRCTAREFHLAVRAAMLRGCGTNAAFPGRRFFVSPRPLGHRCTARPNQPTHKSCDQLLHHRIAHEKQASSISL